MSDPNPYQRLARVMALGCCVVACFVVLMSSLFVFVAANADYSREPMLENVSNAGAVVLTVIGFGSLVAMIVAVAWVINKLFGQDRLPERIRAKAAVGCLRLGGLGCGLWGLVSLTGTLVIGKFITGDPAGIGEVFVGSLIFAAAIFFMLSIAWFISANYAKSQPGEEGRVYQSYLDSVRPALQSLSSPNSRNYIQELTLDVVPKLDAARKGALLGFLGSSGLLSGFTRIALRDADFRGADLRTMSFPDADLRGINLEGACLQGASLFQAKLQMANFKGTDLSGANLQGADLRQADLTGAILEKANLENADLSGAIVSDAQLRTARRKGPFEQQGPLQMLELD